MIALSEHTNAEKLPTLAPGPLGFGKQQMQTELESDRPDFTEGSQPIEMGHLQLETGYSFQKDDQSDIETKTHTVAESLLRVGIMNELELRFSWDAYQKETEDSTRSKSTLEGSGDIALGFKGRLLQQSGLQPDLSLILELGIPTGSAPDSSDKVVPTAKIIWAYELTDTLGVASNINFSTPYEDTNRFLETAASLSLAQALYKDIGAYVEYFGFYANSAAPDQSGTNYLNGGFTWGATENLQFDISAGFGLDEDADDLFGGVGLVCRI